MKTRASLLKLSAPGGEAPVSPSLIQINSQPASEKNTLQGMVPPAAWSKINADNPPTPDAGSFQQKSQAPLGDQFLPKTAMPSEVSMSMTSAKRPPIQDLVKAAMSQSAQYFQRTLQEEGVRQQKLAGVYAQPEQAAAEEEVRTDSVEKLAEAVEFALPYILKHAFDAPPPGATASNEPAKVVQPSGQGTAAHKRPAATLQNGNQATNTLTSPPGGSGQQQTALTANTKTAAGAPNATLQAVKDWVTSGHGIGTIAGATAGAVGGAAAGGPEHRVRGALLGAGGGAALGHASGGVGQRYFGKQKLNLKDAFKEYGTGVGGSVKGVTNRLFSGDAAKPIEKNGPEAVRGIDLDSTLVSGSKKESAARFKTALAKLAEEMEEGHHSPAGPPSKLHIMEALESGKLPATPAGNSSLVSSNQRAIDYKKNEAYAPRKSELAVYLNEPALSSAHDTTLQQAFAHTPAAGVKISSVDQLIQNAAQRAILNRAAAEGK